MSSTWFAVCLTSTCPQESLEGYDRYRLFRADVYPDVFIEARNFQDLEPAVTSQTRPHHPDCDLVLAEYSGDLTNIVCLGEKVNKTPCFGASPHAYPAKALRMALHLYKDKTGSHKQKLDEWENYIQCWPHNRLEKLAPILDVAIQPAGA